MDTDFNIIEKEIKVMNITQNTVNSNVYNIQEKYSDIIYSKLDEIDIIIKNLLKLSSINSKEIIPLEDLGQAILGAKCKNAEYVEECIDRKNNRIFESIKKPKVSL